MLSTTHSLVLGGVMFNAIRKPWHVLDKRKKKAEKEKEDVEREDEQPESEQKRHEKPSSPVSFPSHSCVSKTSIIESLSSISENAEAQSDTLPAANTTFYKHPPLEKSRSEMLLPSQEQLPSPAALARSVSEGPLEKKDGRERKQSTLESYQLAYMTSWPLIGQLAGQQPVPIKRLNFDMQKHQLCSTLTRANKQIRVRMEVATTTNLREMVTMGCRALHYTGHGLPHCLAFEDGSGRMHPLEARVLQKLISAGRGAEGLKLVFVSACHSEHVGQAFVAAGVPHVIAVRHDAQVADSAATDFTTQFYLALLVGRTVAQGFDIAQNAVRSAPHTGRTDEPKKFLLLPPDANHDEAIFADVPEGQWTNITLDPVPTNLGAVPTENFIGRNSECQRIIGTLDRKRCLTICGPPGIGKSVLASVAARYMWERRMHDGGVFFFHMQSAREQGFQSVASYVVAELHACSPNPNASTPNAPATLLSAVASLSRDCTTDQLAQSIGDLNTLFVLDGVDDMLDEFEAALDIRVFVNCLTKRCRHVKLIVTCRKLLGGLQTVVENELALGALRSQDAAQLFYDSVPRELALSDFGATDPSTAGVVLARHPALEKLRGHPGNIFKAANLLSSDVTMGMLPALIDGMEQGRQSQVAEMQQKIGDERGRKFWRHLANTRSLAPFDKFKEAFQFRFLQETQRSDPPLPSVRALTDADFAVIRSKVESVEHPGFVGLTEFGQQWPWLRGLITSVHKIRDLWVQADPVVVQGLIGRAAAADMLQDKPVGTFVLRFSENNLGCLAASFVDHDSTVQHVLIDTSRGFKISLTAGHMTYATLPEMILKCHRLTYLCPTHDKASVFSMRGKASAHACPCETCVSSDDLPF